MSFSLPCVARLCAPLLLGSVAFSALGQTTLIPSGASWRYLKGTTEASSPTTAWRATAFPDTGWSTGAAPLHYGDGLPTGTELGDMRGSYSCVFMRRTFTVTDLAALHALELSVDYDDGFVAWINGTEMARSNVSGDPLYTDIASGSHEGGSPVTFLPAGAVIDLLIEGPNVLAVQAFNVSLSGSSDFRLDAALRATQLDGVPPSILDFAPTAGSVGALTQISLAFSERVVGLKAGDLLLNDQPATSVTPGAQDATFVFSFTQPPPGLVQVQWNEGSQITDVQGNPFDTEAPTSSWSYTLADSASPKIAQQTPVLGALVSTLTQVEVVFSEPVVGVEVLDLLLNGQPATALTGAEVGPYVFTFDPPNPGLVQVSWASGHGITDTSPAANAFEASPGRIALNPDLTLGDVLINEVAASGTSGLADEDQEIEDWIELHNRGTAAVDLLGWSLTDDANAPGKWTFPARVLAPGEILVVFASGKDRRAPTGLNRFHTNFKLNAFGEYLGLFNAESPRVLVAEFRPEYPEQRKDISYGLDSVGAWVYFGAPTPGAPNGNSSIVGIAPPPHFSVNRGVFDSSFDVLLTSPLVGAAIRYTTDGSEPTVSSGTVVAGPLSINSTTTLRAATFAAGYLSSRIQTASYVFLDDVINQPNDPAGFPSTWGTKSGFPNNLVPADYEMDLDPLRVDPNEPASAIEPQKLQRLKDGLRELPIVSVVMDRNDMFGPGGLYPTSSDSNKTPNEKRCSVEMILPDGSTAFVIDGGLDLHGNASRNPLKNPKHGFKLTFKKDYGPTVLEYPLFPDSPAEVFDDLILRPDFNSSWRHWSDVANNGAGAFQRSRGTRTRYAWSQETFRDMGNVSPHTLFFHLFINGLYWGTYDFGEQPTEKFAEAYYGGDTVEFDVYDQGGLRVGTSSAYNAMLSIGNLADNANYERIKELLDMPEFIDYMLLHFYVGHQDWGNTKNWYAVRPRVEGTDGTFKYLPWDQECILMEENVNRVPNGGGNSNVPSDLHTKLDDNAQYRLDFADHVFQQLLAPDGALTPQANISRWQEWQTHMDNAIVAESCRWGDYRRDVHSYSDGTYQLYTRENHWMAENNRLVNSYFVNRGSIVLNQLRAAGLYPSVSAPTFSQHGGRVAAGYRLSISATSGTIYFTTNGTDPRLYGAGTVAPDAQAYSEAIELTTSVTLKARLLGGSTWSALNTATFMVGELTPPLRITEIMYHPDGSEAYEFIELQNVGPLPLDIGGASFQGIDFIFPDNTVMPAFATWVLASSADPTAFGQRYPSVAVAGTYGGSLDNGGERIALVDRTGRTVTAVHYDDEAGWPAEADGGGFSLEVVDPLGDPNGLDNWRASGTVWGGPGIPTTLPALGDILINEVMAENLTAVQNEGAYPDWVELVNQGSTPADLAGWSLTDDSDPRKYVFPAGTALAGSDHLVVWCDGALDAPGLHTGFALGRKGDTVLLYNAQGQRVDAISFGLQVSDSSAGRIDGDWTLTQATPGQPNLAMPLAPSTNVRVNEWLANAAPGASDWVELYNSSPDRAVALRGLSVGAGGQLARIQSLSFLPPAGFAQLLADEAAGADHLELRLPAAGSELVLYDDTGLELERVTYGAQVEGISEGRLPDGTPSIVSFPGSVSPAASNYVRAYTGPVLNEVLARNQRGQVSPWGSVADWIELHNPGPADFDLGGMSLARGTSAEDNWTFPLGTFIGAGDFVVVWCDGARAASSDATSGLNTGFSLDGSSGDIFLLNLQRQTVDTLAYGFQMADRSVGRHSGGWGLLDTPTPGAPNAAASALGPVSALQINEWMADPLTGDDWFELYNRAALPVDMSGLYLSDDPSTAGRTNTRSAPFSFVESGRWVKWIADADSAKGRNHVNFRLDPLGESLRLYSPDLTLLEVVTFGVQTPGVSQGRLLDGAANLVNFPDSASPGEANYLLLTNIVINEILTHTDAPLEDAVELQNAGTTPLDMSGWYLSDSVSDPKRYRIPDNTILGAAGYAVFYRVQFGPAQGDVDTPPLFSFNSAHGDAVHLFQTDAGGNLTGYRASVEFDAAANGVSFGRIPTSVGVDFGALSERTFGVDAPATLEQFRSGTGLPNAEPLVGPVVITEILFQPLEGPGNGGEFIELFNPTSTAVPLYDVDHPTNRWRLTGAVTFELPADAVLAPGGFLIVVPFDPATDLASLAAFQEAYGMSGVLVGPYSGNLGNDGENLELRRPDTPQSATAPDAGFVPYIVVERVDYGSAPPWPTNATAGVTSLQRIQAEDYGNDPVNWVEATPTGGRPTDSSDPGRAPPLSVTGVEAGQITIEFTALAGRTYSLLYRDDLAAGQWVKASDVEDLGMDRTAIVIDPAPSDNGRFYQLVTPATP